MNQNKINAIQNTMDELSYSLNIMISDIKNTKNNNSMVYSSLSKYIKSELPIYHQKIKDIEKNILEVSIDKKDVNTEISEPIITLDNDQITSVESISTINEAIDIEENDTVITIADTIEPHKTLEDVSISADFNIFDTIISPSNNIFDDFDLGEDIDLDIEGNLSELNITPTDKIELDYLDSFLEEWEVSSPQISTYIFELQNENEGSVPVLQNELNRLKGSAELIGALSLSEKINKIEKYVDSLLDGTEKVTNIADNIYEKFEEVKIIVSSIENGIYDKSVLQQNINELNPNSNEMLISPLYSNNDIDEELSEEQWAIFIEEYEELEPKIDGLINKLVAGDKTSIVELSRDLHSIKGSVGTTGALKARKAIHEIETIIEKIKFEVNELDKNIPLDIAKNVMSRFDFFRRMVSEINKGNFDNYESLGKVKNNKVEIKDLSNKNIDIDFKGKIKDESVVKVNVEILNFLFNEVNEVKLGNASNETSILQLGGHLKEFEENVNILSKMLRNLELETEGQMQSRRLLLEEAKLAGLETEMDSLEFDRYEDIHELVRSFGEGVNDTFDIYQAFVKVISEMQAISITQNRSIMETQESLSKARLIPFSSRTDGLQYLVKSTAIALGKKAILITENDSIEVDRALLDKLRHVLDHTLRNCLTHGIETPQIRKSVGKREEGTIQITLKQEGGRLYISIEDDGAGININKIREKAIEKGLWDASVAMSDSQAADMISLPSFSTADKVDDYAGRGIGLDVVRNDILSMGGKYEISSVFGKGMKVDIQIPTSISTVFALIVTTGTETLAIPAEIIEEVKFLTKEDVIDAHSKGRITVNIDGSDVEVDFRYLSDLIGITDDINEMANYKHLVVCKDRDNIIAVLVDKLIGVKELPIKPLGRTLSSIPGVVSATILPNGVAAFIIDPARARTSLLRYYGIENKESKLPNKNIIDIVNEVSSKKLIMVVDDSLTVRKATARFLQREGYDYILAKDGQNAIEMLATATPDLILLDVEMPRMDGFGLAKHVREHQRHSNVPIIMITSRTAPKHKQRSEALGVNEYMGKPFKEEELLENIKKYTG